MYAMVVLIGILFFLMLSSGIYEYFENFYYNWCDDDDDNINREK